MNYRELQKAWVDENCIKQGDMVRVTSKAASYEQGWNNVWVRDMDFMVGNIYRVTEVAGGSGIGLLLDQKKGDEYQFPYFILEKVTPVVFTPCQNHDFEGYDEGHMDSVSASNYWDNIANPEYWGNIDSVDCSEPANTTATLTFNLEDSDSYELFQVYAQAQRLYNFAFEVSGNMYRNLENELDNDPDMPASVLLEYVRQSIESLIQSHKIDIE
jgi:hypothetical protein